MKKSSGKELRPLIINAYVCHGAITSAITEIIKYRKKPTKLNGAILVHKMERIFHFCTNGRMCIHV